MSRSRHARAAHCRRADAAAFSPLRMAVFLAVMALLLELMLR